MVVDERTTPDVRSSAQNLFNLVVFGVGPIFGNLLAGWLDAWTKVGGKTDWPAYYSIPGWLTLLCLLALWVFYRTPPLPPPSQEPRDFEVATIR